MSGYLIHYASPYYDPVKAHEYYEEHKKLKGRSSSAGLNDKGKEAYRYVKEQLSQEKKSRIEKAKATRDSEVQSASSQKKSESERETSALSSKVNSLKERLSKMSKAQKAVHRDAINAEIDALRQQTARRKQQLAEQYAASRNSANSKYNSEKESANSDYQSKLQSELDSIKSDKSMLSTKKAKGSSSKGRDWEAERKKFVERQAAKQKK